MKLPPAVRDELDASGLPWSVEIGGKHFRLLVDGQLATIFPRGTGRDIKSRQGRNLLAHVRRFLKERKDNG